MTPPPDKRFGIGAVARARLQMPARPESPLPAYNKHSEALKFRSEMTSERIKDWNRRMPLWIRCELRRFVDGVEWGAVTGSLGY